MSKKSISKGSKRFAGKSPASQPGANTTEAHAPVGPPGPRPRLHRLRVSNFRCIGPDPVEIELDDIVVLVGPNNAGKTSILRAYQTVVAHGSKEGELTEADFPDGQCDRHRPPTIELETVVYENNKPGDRWVRKDSATGDLFVKEKWTWNGPGAPTKVGWDCTRGVWHESEGPWGAAGVAQPNRPRVHRLGAFDDPQTQAKAIIGLLTKAITDRVKALSNEKTPAGDGQPTQYAQLMEKIRTLRAAIATDSTNAVEEVRRNLSGMIHNVFRGYEVEFDPRPEDDIEKALNLYKPNPELRMGPTNGYKAPLDRQGSGALRTMMWAALKILAEHGDPGDVSELQRANVLLMDEPEICLHPGAIRDACRVLYNLPQTGLWQVMITTHSPVFIDLSRDNTSIVRVERDATGKVGGTTIFRPRRTQLGADDKENLKLLNICDPYIAEFFFGGRTVVVEGDTEYAVFCEVAAQDPEVFKDVHVVRARGKACIKSLCKILNQFGKPYGVLHDADRPRTTNARDMVNPAWTLNAGILEAVSGESRSDSVILIASVPNFEEAFLDAEVGVTKPYAAWSRVKTEPIVAASMKTLLRSLIGAGSKLPPNALRWSKIDALEATVTEFDSANSSHRSDLHQDVSTPASETGKDVASA